MKILNIEIKARCSNPERIRTILKDADARHEGQDHQVDTYFNTPAGRLKLRQGNIDNALIAYTRVDQSGPKQSNVLLYKTQDSEGLKSILDCVLETRVVVDKRRDIFFIENVKFHLDTVTGLGDFVEIEAIDDTGKRSQQELHKQCVQYMTPLEIPEEDLLTPSYSDMMINENENEN
jgi:predicted adenylyl cyclase CyaB